MPVYLKLETVKGSVKDARFEGWLEFDSISFGPPNSGKAVPRERGREDKPSTTTTLICITSSATDGVAMHNASVKNIHLGKATIVFENGQPGRTFGIAIDDTFVTEFSISRYGAGHAQPVFTFSIEAVNLRQLTEAEVSNITTPSVPEPPRRRRGR